jgi:hypothetical protein
LPGLCDFCMRSSCTAVLLCCCSCDSCRRWTNQWRAGRRQQIGCGQPDGVDGRPQKRQCHASHVSPLLCSSFLSPLPAWSSVRVCCAVAGRGSSFLRSRRAGQRTQRKQQQLPLRLGPPPPGCCLHTRAHTGQQEGKSAKQAHAPLVCAHNHAPPLGGCVSRRFPFPHALRACCLLAPSVPTAARTAQAATAETSTAHIVTPGAGNSPRSVPFLEHPDEGPSCVRFRVDLLSPRPRRSCRVSAHAHARPLVQLLTL